MVEETRTALEVTLSRRFETKDIVKRLGFISPKMVEIENYEASPITIFNPGAYIEKNVLRVYARTVFGYYRYISSIALFEIPIEEVLDGSFAKKRFRARLVVYPSSRYDMWGTEDPRVSPISNGVAMVYSARTIAFFDEHARTHKSLPLLAMSRDGVEWEKRALFMISPSVCSAVYSDKDAFVADFGDKGVWLFHRPNIRPPTSSLCRGILEGINPKGYEMLLLSHSMERQEGVFILLASRIDIPQSFRVVEISDSRVMMYVPRFEWKAGWGTPLYEIKPGKWLTILHGVDRYDTAYRAFAAVVELEDGKPIVTRVTQRYIMEPRDPHEIYGDRTLVVFPTGGGIVDNKLVLVYGAADSFIGIGVVDLDELLAELNL
ncbi:MAG TPA: hypothetical protein EYH02_04520 [Ignisphaera aggregans]|uniref:Glycosidase n=1 Tax=Ignisphaera aggregans TaxID=334771 RepID=A0A832YYS8_9CREN|nr:hypothetical protein [Ignisphaera aggregans]